MCALQLRGSWCDIVASDATREVRTGVAFGVFATRANPPSLMPRFAMRHFRLKPPTMIHAIEIFEQMLKH
jgi:hypothetical protein